MEKSAASESAGFVPALVPAATPVVPVAAPVTTSAVVVTLELAPVVPEVNTNLPPETEATVDVPLDALKAEDYGHARPGQVLGLARTVSLGAPGSYDAIAAWCADARRSTSRPLSP